MLIPNLKTKLRNFESLVWSRSIFMAPAPVGPERAGSSSGSATPAMNMHLINIGESPASISIESIIGKCCSGSENICWIRVKNQLLGYEFEFGQHQRARYYKIYFLNIIKYRYLPTQVLSVGIYLGHLFKLRRYLCLLLKKSKNLYIKSSSPKLCIYLYNEVSAEKSCLGLEYGSGSGSKRNSFGSTTQAREITGTYSTV